MQINSKNRNCMTAKVRRRNTMKRRVLGFAFCLIVAMGIAPAIAIAAEAPAFSGGTGTADDPYLISTTDDLVALSDFVNEGHAASFDAHSSGYGYFYGYYFEQTADLDFSGKANWIPIGYDSTNDVYFAGTYDGKNHTVSNLASAGRVDSGGRCTGGVFGYLMHGSISNLHVVDAFIDIVGQNYCYVGGISGIAYGGTIENCSTTNSFLSSKRESNNSNCVGGIVGFSAGATVSKCGSVGNTVNATCYGGGLVGELDNDASGESTFTDCFVANCTVVGKSDKGGIGSEVGCFSGIMSNGNLNMENCYVYNSAAKIDPSSASVSISSAGLLTGNNWSHDDILTTNCYYGLVGTSAHAGAAAEKTAQEFSDGTVRGLLGNSFANGDAFPLIASHPADYAKVHAEITRADALDPSFYKDFSAVTSAINGVVAGKLVAEQPIVDGYAFAIESAIDALVYRDADYSKVNAALAKIPADLSTYTEASAKALADAKRAVILGKNITEQAAVDEYANTIERAITALEKKPVTPFPTEPPAQGGNESAEATPSQAPPPNEKDRLARTGDRLGSSASATALAAAVALLIGFAAKNRIDGRTARAASDPKN